MTDTEPTVDLSQVQWSVEYRVGLPFVIGLEHQPDGYDEVVYELRPGYTRDTNGADRTDLFADVVARKLSETDSARWGVEDAAQAVVALLRDRNIASPGPAYEIALAELAKTLNARGQA